jgi:hypothetical protein
MMRRAPCRVAARGDGFIAGPILLLGLLAGCKSGDRAAAAKSESAAAAPAVAIDTSGIERPLWQFGESSVRTDTLPPELDSLRDWGGYSDAERPVAYAIDVNRDGRSDWLVRSSTGLCGPFGGCPTRLLTRDATGKWTAPLDQLARDVMVTNKVVNGWPVLWIYLGGIDGGVFRMVLRDGAYQMSATLLARRDMSEWTAEQYAADTIWQRIQSVRVP